MAIDSFTLVDRIKSARMIANDIVTGLDGGDVAEILMDANARPILLWDDVEILDELEFRGLLDVAIEHGFVVKNT